MPVLIPAVIAGSGAVIGAAVAGTAITVGTFFSAFAQTLVLTAVARALQKEPADTSLESRTQSVRTPIGPRQFIYGQIRTGGQVTSAELLGLTTQGTHVITLPDGSTTTIPTTVFARTMNLWITFSGHEVEEIGAIRFGNEVIPLDDDGRATGRFANFALVKKALGTDDDEIFADYRAISGAPVTFRQRGCAKIYVRLSKNNDLYPDGVPNITAVIKGKKVYDPRTGLTAWSDNPALCIADYLCTPKTRGGMGADYATEIHEAELIAAANICDETVVLASGGTEKRYTLNGAFTLAQKPEDIVRSMLSAMAGTAVNIGGQWILRAGAYRTPTVTLTDGHARGPIKVQARLSRAEIFNGVKGVFTNPVKFWQADDFPPVTNAMYLAEDGGERLWHDVELGFTTSAAMAQRLAKIDLERARQQITEVFPGKLSCYKLQPGDTVMRTSADMGWDAKVFEVVKTTLVVFDADGGPALGVDLVLRETASTVWDWNSGEETTVDPAPDSNLGNPFTPRVPGISSIAEVLYETTGSAGVKARVEVTLGLDDDGSNPDFSVEYALTSVETWQAAPLTKNLVTLIDDLAPGSYAFRARSFNSLGVASEYSAITTREILGLTAPPADITGFSVRAMGGAAWVVLDKHTDLDVIQGGRIMLRWSPSLGASWNDGSLLSADGWPGDSVLIMAPLYSGTYLAKARDSTGNLSENAVSFEITDANLTSYTTLTTLTEDPTFSGSKTSLAVVGGGLELSGSTAVDSIADVDAVADWDGEGGTATEGEYLFNTTMNLGSVQTVRLFPHQRGTNTDTGDQVDDRPLTIDDWADIDGALVDDVEATLYVRITQTDPTGSPTWAPWHPLIGPADYTFWGAQFKLVYVSADQTHNRNVDQLRVAAKQAA